MAKKAKGKNYEELANQIIDLIGGKDNIVFFTYCTTRLRFNLKDRSTINIKEIERQPGVLGSQWSNEELQIIIGPAVADAYNLICTTHNLEGQVPINENLDGDMPKGKISFKAIMDGISGSITPLIPMMIGCGMIKLMAILLEMIGLLSAESTTYAILSFVGDAGFYFFPVFLGYSSARKFNANISLGILMGAIFMHPDFISMVTSGEPISLFGIPVYAATYANSVLPTILAVWVMSKVEKFFTKISPKVLRSFLVPLCTILIMLPIALCVVGPVGSVVGTYVSNIIVFIYEKTGFFGVALLSAVLPLLVITGMHTMLTPYWTTAMASLGYDPFFLPAMIISNLNQASASLAVSFRAKDTNTKSTAMSCSVTAFVAGVTEPAMFGISLKYRTPLYAAMIGNFVGAAYIGLMSVYCYAFPGSGGVFALIAFFGPTVSNIIHMVIGSVIGIAVTFVLTWIFGIKEENI